MTDTLEQVYEFIKKYRMLNEGDKVLVAVSGGADSVALLDMLFCLRHRLGISLQVAHLNHMFRAEESLGDAVFVENLAALYDLPVTVRHIDVPAYKKQFGLSTQPAARTVRYNFLKETAVQEAAARVALAHHADDQAETVLLHFLRGTGAAGLRGMLPVRDNFYIRPILCLRRQDIDNYCTDKNLAWRLDSSNLKTDYRRNKIRMHLLPLLEKEYNHKLVPALNRLGEICRDEEDYLEVLTHNEYNKLTVFNSAGEIRLSVRDFQRIPLALQRRVLRLAWRKITGGFHDLSFEQVDKALDLLRNHASSGRVELSGGVGVVKSYETFSVTACNAEQVVQRSYSYEVMVPGQVCLAEINKTLCCEVLTGEAVAKKYKGISLERFKLPPNEALLDYDRVSFPLHVRGRQEGDVFSPLGLAGSMKLKKYFINQKVSREDRDKTPLVVGGGKIIWVGGMQIAESVKINSNTTSFLYLKLIEFTDILI